jgi:hypothetical protein
MANECTIILLGNQLCQSWEKPFWTPAVLFIRVDRVDSDDGDRPCLENTGFYLHCSTADHHTGLHNTITNYHGHDTRNSDQQFKNKNRIWMNAKLAHGARPVEHEGWWKGAIGFMARHSFPDLAECAEALSWWCNQYPECHFSWHIYWTSSHRGAKCVEMLIKVHFWGIKLWCTIPLILENHIQMFRIFNRNHSSFKIQDVLKGFKVLIPKHCTDGTESCTYLHTPTEDLKHSKSKFKKFVKQNNFFFRFGWVF